ncbi:MAG: hypothetical protein L3J97_05320, partial [Thermoplasmata archaeon]|nr:hypothetical protein [Thermoplasmata archaeon]
MVFFPVATFLSLVVGAVLAPPGSNAADIVRDMLYALVIPLVVGAALGGQLLTRLPYRTVAGIGIVAGTIGMFGLTRLTTSTPLWTFYAGIFPVGGLIVWLIPMGFGIGLTFPVFLLAAQNLVGTADVGEAGGLIQFIQSLGGAVGLAVLASFQQTRFAALDPSPSAACSTLTPPFPECAGFLTALPQSLLQSYDQTFSVMLGLLVIALVFVLFLRGRLPRKTSSATAKPGPVTPLVGEGTGEPALASP